MIYTDAWIEEGYFDERAVSRIRDVEVEIGTQTIRVEWREGLHACRYEGTRNGQGHFLLRSEDSDGDATLHRFQLSTILEGFWKRNDQSGFWRVHLPLTAMADIAKLPKRRKPAAAKRKKPVRRAKKVA